jgi:hypothetical protein
VVFFLLVKTPTRAGSLVGESPKRFFAEEII